MSHPIPTEPSPTPAEKKRAWLKPALFATLVAFTALHLAPEDLIESIFCGAIYPKVFGLQKAVFGALPFSASEALLALAVGTLPLLCLRGLSRLLRRTCTPGDVLRAGAARLSLWACLLYLGFLGLWGFHHARLPYATHLGLDLYPGSPDLAVQTAELESLCRSLVAGCNEFEPLVDSETLSLVSKKDQGASLHAMAELSRSTPIFGAMEPSFRIAAGSSLLSRLGISGIYSPFTGDAHVNGQQPIWARPFTACHEMAHQLGIAREGEANFVAWQACMEYGSSELRYSAYMVALGAASNALFGLQGGREDSVVFEILADLSPEVQGQRERAAAWWAEQMGLAGDLALATNDAYLRSQGQTEGIASYGFLVDLLLADRRKARAELGDGKQAAE